jgi:hypothetical protein
VTYEKLDPVAQHANELAELTGAYRSPDAGTLWNLVFERGSLLITNSAGWKLPLESVGSDRFIVGPWSLHFLRDSAGRPTGIALHRARLWDLRFEKLN